MQRHLPYLFGVDKLSAWPRVAGGRFVGNLSICHPGSAATAPILLFMLAENESAIGSVVAQLAGSWRRSLGHLGRTRTRKFAIVH